MSMSASAFLAYGINFGEDKPGFLADYDGELYEWAEENDEAIESLPYFVDGYTVLAVPGHVHDADYGSLVTEIENLDVDAAKVDAFKQALIEAGYPNPQPKWLLSFFYG